MPYSSEHFASGLARTLRPQSLLLCKKEGRGGRGGVGPGKGGKGKESERGGAGKDAVPPRTQSVSAPATASQDRHKFLTLAALTAGQLIRNAAFRCRCPPEVLVARLTPPWRSRCECFLPSKCLFACCGFGSPEMLRDRPIHNIEPRVRCVEATCHILAGLKP